MRSARLEQVNVRVTAEERRRLDDLAHRRGYRSASDLLRAEILCRAAEERAYTVVIHPDETGYWAEVPALQGCNAAGETYAECLADAQRAIEGYIQMLRKLGEAVPVEKRTSKGPFRAIVRVVV